MCHFSLLSSRLFVRGVFFTMADADPGNSGAPFAVASPLVVSSAPDPAPVRFPPFPPVPGGVTIRPFSTFKEYGIQIFTDPETGNEIDGLGIPTIRLRIPHNTDAPKTQTPKGGKPRNSSGEVDGDEGNDDDADDDEAHGEGKTNGKNKKKKKKKKGPGTSRHQSLFDLPDLSTIKDPIERAQEQKRRRLVMFAKREWWELWAEGEDLRRGKIYDTNISPSDRLHISATEFRTGRVWPPGSSRLRFLWDQVRLLIIYLCYNSVFKKSRSSDYMWVF